LHGRRKERGKMKAVLISIQPYWVFLIIAKIMGWNIGKEKTFEVRKNYPKAENWNKVAKIYCSKDKRSFSKIPKEYQPFMERLLGKVIGEFVCDTVLPISVKYSNPNHHLANREFPLTCLTDKQIMDYLGNGKEGYGWHISDLKIYDKPKSLKSFQKPCVCTDEYEGEEYHNCLCCDFAGDSDYGIVACNRPITRPPQSWCYVEEQKDG
jgi:hypothetical protein